MKVRPFDITHQTKLEKRMLTECEDMNGDVTPHGLQENTSEHETRVEAPPIQNPSIEDSSVFISLKSKLEGELIAMRKELDMALKAKEMTVMRYANSEKEVLRQRKELETAEKQMKNLQKETESLHKKNKMLSSERERLIHMVDSKVCDLQTANKECGRLKDEISAKDFKIKWAQTKLNAETEAHKETQQKLLKVTEDLQAAFAEASKMRTECQDMIDSCVTDSSLNTEDRNDEVSESIVDSSQINPFKKEVETLKLRHRALIDENNSFSCRVQTLQEDRLEMEQRLARLQESNSDHLHQIASLQSDLAIADSYKVQVQKDQERMAALQSECDRLRQINAELISDMSQCRAKESELLAYTQKVTEKNVFLQSEFSATEGKNALLEQEIERLRNQIEKITIDTKNRIEMERERQCHAQNEKKLLTEELETQKQQIVSLQEKLDYLIGEGELFKRRHETSLRELTKELQTAVRMSGDEISRTSSSTSINSLNKPDDDLNHQKKNTESPSESEAPAIPDQQILVEKIIQLRKLLLKKDEKIEFIQGMNKDLVEQLQKKSKLVNCFLMNQEVGTLSTDISDQNKAEAMKRGGLMASLYGGKNSDQLLTLDLSLRINQQLQSLLEDTILKNLKLKENIDTLSSQLEMKNARK